MASKQIFYEMQANTIIKNLAKHNIEGFYCPTSEDAVKLALGMIDEKDLVSYAGTVTFAQCGLRQALRDRGNELITRPAGITEDEARELHAKMVMSDVFVMSANALTVAGELVNIDGMANRVSLLCYGPKKVIVIAGVNKIVPDVESGLARVRNMAAPPNAVRLKRNTPCAVTGVCADCYAKDCMCSEIVVTRRSSYPDRIKVIIVGEELGY